MAMVTRLQTWRLEAQVWPGHGGSQWKEEGSNPCPPRPLPHDLGFLHTQGTKWRATISGHSLAKQPLGPIYHFVLDSIFSSMTQTQITSSVISSVDKTFCAQPRWQTLGLKEFQVAFHKDLDKKRQTDWKVANIKHLLWASHSSGLLSPLYS